jgi:predicted ATPase
MVVFRSASAALGCAVGMQQCVEQGNRESAEPVGLRVGLSVGEVSNEDGDYFGDPVVEAARLCSHCDTGQILATDFVRAMAGRRSRHKCRSLGELTLKGLPVPVESIEVVWEPLDGPDLTEMIPLPGHLAVHPAAGVVGRDTEVAAITDAVKSVESGGGRQILLVSGEAGLGKTTVVAEAARSAFEAGACVLFGHCEEDLATSYQLFAEALGHYVTHASEEQLAAHVEAHGSELSRLVPALNSRIPDLPTSKATDADTERFLLFSAAVGLLAMASEHQPVVLVLDDLQWADKGSLLLLRHLASADPTMRVLILGTYRDSEISTADALVDALAALHRLDGITRIDLVGLDHIGVVALMEAGTAYPLDDAAVGLAHAIHRETDGNPFFVSEVLRNLVETGAIGQDADGRWVAEDTLDATALPDSVREVIGARVLRLGKNAGRILSMAAVIGRDFDLQLLAVATNSAEDHVLDVLDSAAAVSLVRELADTPGRFTFAHALIQHTLSEDLGPTRRARGPQERG